MKSKNDQKGISIPPQKKEKTKILDVKKISAKDSFKQQEPKGNPNRFDGINAETERSNRESK